MDCIVRFDIDKDLYENYLSSPALVQKSSTKVEIVKRVEEIVGKWKSKIEMVILFYRVLL